MTKTVTVKLSRGTYTCPNTGKEQDSAMLLSREDEPGVAYPFPYSAYYAELVVEALHLNGLSLFTGLRGTEVFEENPEFPPVSFEVYVTAPGSKEVH